MTDEFYDQAADAEAGLAPAWKPNEGDWVGGTVVRYERGTTEYGSSPICIVKVEAGAGAGRYGPTETRPQLQGECSIWIFHQVLRDEFASKRPAPGERLWVRRLPDGTTQAGVGYKNYSLGVDREEQGGFPEHLFPGTDYTDVRQKSAPPAQAPAEAYEAFGGPPVEEAFSNAALNADGKDLPF